MSEVTSVNGETGAVVLTATSVGAVPSAEVGVPNGVATLDSGGALHMSQLPGSVVVSSPTLTALRAVVPTAGWDYMLTEALKQGFWRFDPSDTTSADNGGTIVVTTGGSRLKRVWSGGVRPEWFGAKGDWVDTSPTTGEGTDDTEAFQNAINALIAGDLGCLELDPARGYLINGTVYINQSGESSLTWVPVSLRGLPGNPAGSRGHSSRIIRTKTGDIFRVNLDSSGHTVLGPTEQYLGFSCENVSFIGKSVEEGVTVTGINAIKAFRTRCALRNAYASYIDYLMYQPDTDAGGVNTNYCDHSTYDNIRVSFSTKSGMRISKNDAGKIRGFVFDSPTSSVTGALELIYGAGYSVEGLLFHTASTEWTPPAGSAFLYLYEPRGAKISALHIERQIAFEATVSVYAGYATEVDTASSAYQGNTFLRTNQSIGTKLSGWYALDERQNGYYDIEILGTNVQNEVSWERLSLFNAAGGAARTEIIYGPAGFTNSAGRPASLQAGSYLVPLSPGATTTSVTLGNGTLRVGVWDIRTPTRIVKLGAEVTVIGDVGSTLRLGVWAEVNGVPGKLLIDGGTISGSTATVQDGSNTVDVTLTPGRYFIGAVIQGVTVTQPTVRICNAAALTTASLSASIPTANQLINGYQETGVTGALGAWTAGRSVVSSGAVPRLHVKTG